MREPNNLSDLFLRKRNDPFTFFISPVDERCRLITCVEDCGGKVVAKVEQGSLCFVKRGHKVPRPQTGVFYYSSYIDNCIKEGQLLSLNKYSIRNEDYLDDEQVRDEDVDPSPDVGVRNIPVPTQNTKRYTSSHKGRVEYKPEEDQSILVYLRKHNLLGSVKGRAMWVTMEKKGVLPGRTWQSLRCRYLKIIAVNQDNMFAPKDSSSTWLKKRVKLVDAVDQINTGNKANTRVRHSDSGRMESKDSSGKVKLSMVPSTTAARLDQTESRHSTRHSINGDVCEPSTSTQVDPVRAESSSKNERKRGARGKPLSVSSGYSYSEDDDAALALSPTKCQGRSDVGGNNIHGGYEASESSTDSEDVAGEVEQAGPTVWQGATMPAAASLEETVSVARSLMDIYQISLEDLDAEIIKHQGDVNAVMDSLDLRESNSTDESLQY